MTTSTGPAAAGWHVDPRDLAHYREGTTGAVTTYSIEAHLLCCAQCRAALTAATAGADRDRRWNAIVDRIDRPTRGAHVAGWLRLAVGTPEFALSALTLLVLIVAAPVVVSVINPWAGVTWFLAAAPAAPLAGAVLAYRASADPAGELTPATPLHTFRIVVVRALVVLLAALPLMVGTALLLPSRTPLLLGWIVPGLALCAIVLAAGTRVEPLRLGVVLWAGWVVLVSSDLQRHRARPLGEALQRIALNQPAAQAAFACVAVAAAVVFVVRRDAVTYSVR